jgi:hypothetical protein
MVIVDRMGRTARWTGLAGRTAIHIFCPRRDLNGLNQTEWVAILDRVGVDALTMLLNPTLTSRNLFWTVTTHISAKSFSVM